MDLIPFLGRFHVVALHLPIGILALTAGLEIYFGISRRHHRPEFLGNLWLVGTLSALVTSGLGYLLSLSGGYNEDAVTLHLIWGVATTFIALIGWVAFGLTDRRTKAWTIGLGGAQLISLSIAGHLGGSLTHGPEFLFEHAPNPVRTLAGFPPRTDPRPAITTLDDADVFLDVVQPVLELRCTSCHNPSKTKGDLLLDTYAHIMKGGESGPVVSPGDLAASELSVRINLNPAHDDFMPSGGKTPLTAAQTNVLDWWIQSGAPASGLLGTLSLTPEIRTLLSEVLHQKAPAQEAPQVFESVPPSLTSDTIMQLESLGFDVRQLSLTNPNLVIDYYRVDSVPIPDAKLQALLVARDQLRQLNLGNSGLTDNQLAIVAQLTRLTRLNIDRNPITDAGIGQLRPLVNLETLVAHSTAVSDAALDVLDQLPALQKAYLWGSAVTNADRSYIILGPASAAPKSPEK